MIKILKIISGGQTGADRAGLDAAIALGVPHGGKCPRGRKAEDGVIPTFYNLEEMDSPHYEDRTEANIVDSDATVLFISGRMTPGATLTQWLAKQYTKPCLKLDLQKLEMEEAVSEIERWFTLLKPSVVNIAGTRESKAPGIGKKVFNILSLVLASHL